MTLRIFISFLLLSLTVSSFADCQYIYQDGQSDVGWTAFKTPKKVGVGAKFDRYHIAALPGKSILDVLRTGAFSIDASSVNSGNKGRDKKIANFFFSTMEGGSSIKGVVTRVLENKGKKGKLEVLITMNGNNRAVPMEYTLDESSALLTGSIDVLDFAMSDELKSLNNACKTLHQGKTWSDVNLTLKANFKKVCN